MIAPERPTNEADRLSALRNLEILDTPTEERFDRITRLASQALNAPIAVISLVDDQREWFKASCGNEVRQGSRDSSFCGHTILSSETFVIPNCLEDERFKDNPQVTGPSRIRFYAGHPIYAPGGERIGALCVKDTRPREFGPDEARILRDLTAVVESELAHVTLEEVFRLRLEAERERDHYFRVSLDMLCVAGFDGYFKQVNPAWSNTLGWSEEELFSKPFIQFVHPDDREKTTEEAGRISDGGTTATFVNRYLCRNGSYRTLLWTAFPLTEKELIYACAKDITELERNKQELQEFAFVASHDLQEPLRKVQAFGDRLMSQYGESLDERGRDFLSRMQNAAERMQKLIQGLLSFTRVNTKAESFGPVPMNQLIEEVLSDLEIRIEQVRGKVEVDDLPVVNVDQLQMQQLFQNLIGNALKFHREDVPPVVRVSCTSGTESNPFMEIVVADNGIGFDQAYEDKIFGVFQRLHGRDQYDGTGLGLAVCRRIVERHGGTIAATGSPGEGSKFTVRLPKNEHQGENTT